jgi:hypothetical protein
MEIENGYEFGGLWGGFVLFYNSTFISKYMQNYQLMKATIPNVESMFNVHTMIIY